MEFPALDMAVGKKRVEDRVVLDGVNFVLRHFVRPRPPRSRVLVVAPLSGHFGWLMRDTVLELLPHHDVALLEWKDARHIPAAAGRLGLDATIAAVMESLRHLGPGVTLLGVSQAPTTILAAAALMAATNEDERPRALVLMGGFIDPRRNPTSVGKMTAGLPRGWFTRRVSAMVPEGEAGAGRLVYQGQVHGVALGRYLARHMATGGELYHKVKHDDGADSQGFPFIRLYSTLMDVPAEFAEDNARMVFAEAHLARGLLVWRGRAVEPEAMADMALMTIEGGQDDSSGPEQTHAAHLLCRNVPPDLRSRHTEAEVGHFGLFHGQQWKNSIRPKVTAFLHGLPH